MPTVIISLKYIWGKFIKRLNTSVIVDTLKNSVICYFPISGIHVLFSHCFSIYLLMFSVRGDKREWEIWLIVWIHKSMFSAPDYSVSHIRVVPWRCSSGEMSLYIFLYRDSIHSLRYCWTDCCIVPVIYMYFFHVLFHLWKFFRDSLYACVNDIMGCWFAFLELSLVTSFIKLQHAIIKSLKYLHKLNVFAFNLLNIPSHLTRHDFHGSSSPIKVLLYSEI